MVSGGKKRGNVEKETKRTIKGFIRHYSGHTILNRKGADRTLVFTQYTGGKSYVNLTQARVI